VRRHALRLLRLLWRRSQTRTALGRTASHYSTEEVAGSMANLRRLGLRRAVRVLAGATTGFYFALELRNTVFVSRQQPVSFCCVLSVRACATMDIELEGRRSPRHARG
jgi:hypothetical protein